ncbi:MAG: hypothetical protein II630_07310 [Bacteroidales bacterium]|nr:hypothetical protein [Bacteroidales bacterium]
MIKTTTYKGTLNGARGLWCGFKPEGLEVEQEITVYKPDEGKVFTKDGEIFDCVVITNGVKISSYEEIDAPEPEKGDENGEERNETVD